MKNILMLDLETTGLDPAKEQILEIGAIAIQVKDDKTLEIGDEFHTLVRPSFFEESFELDFLDLMVCKHIRNPARTMHEENCLIPDLLNLEENITIQIAEKKLTEFIDSQFGSGAMRIELGGSSVHFDQSFINHHMPELSKRLSYRVMDMTPYRTVRNLLFKIKEPKIVAHRAIDDIRYSLSLFEEMFEVIKNHKY